MKDGLGWFSPCEEYATTCTVVLPFLLGLFYIMLLLTREELFTLQM